MEMLITTILIISVVNVASGQLSDSNIWFEGGRFVRRMWNECTLNSVKLKGRSHSDVIQPQFYPSMLKCLKRKTIIALDRTLGSDVIPLYDGIDLVRYYKENSTDAKSNERKLLSENQGRSDGQRADSEWRSQVLDRLVDVLNTHVIKVDLDDEEPDLKTQARRRRRHHHMLPIMMFGMLAMSMVLIPMGFKFLAVLGGKALLLAKMALLLASIQGLKKVATSGFNYGLYHSPVVYPGWHERHGRGEYDEHNQPPYPYDGGYNHDPDVQMGFG